MLPAPIDVLRRWPRAVALVSALILHGDQKHQGDGRATNERGAPIDNDRYDSAYSYEKLTRHLLRLLGGEEFDEETGLPNGAAIAWHALNALEADAKKNGVSVDGIIDSQPARNQRIKEMYG